MTARSSMPSSESAGRANQSPLRLLGSRRGRRFEIDQINILQASRLAMHRAVESLAREPDYLLIDALKLDLPIEQLR